MSRAVVAHIESEPYSGEVYDFTIPGDETFWAERVLVHNCQPCAAIDGREYTDLAAAREDYPSSGYRSCAGRLRCRGILFVTFNGQGLDDARNGPIPDAELVSLEVFE